MLWERMEAARSIIEIDYNDKTKPAKSRCSIQWKV